MFKNIEWPSDNEDEDLFKCMQFPCASHPEYRAPSTNVFEQEHGRDLCYISNLDAYGDSFSAELEEKSVDFLNRFHGLLTKLSIHFKLNNVGALLDAIANNCSDKIVALKFDDFTDFDENMTRKQKQGLKKIIAFVQNLGKTFPNIRYLTFEHRNKYNCQYWEAIVQSMPSLTHLTIHGRFDMSILERFIKLNPQIESLGVHFNEEGCCGSPSENEQGEKLTKLPANWFIWLDNALPELKHLYFNFAFMEKWYDVKLRPVAYFKKLKTIAWVGYCVRDWNPKFRLLGGDELEYLEFSYYFPTKQIDPIADELSRFKNLKELTINAFFDPSHLVVFTWTPAALCAFILTKQQLQKITIRKCIAADDGFFYAPVNSKLGNEYWQKVYRTVIDKNLNGKWHVSGNSQSVEFRKVAVV